MTLTSASPVPKLPISPGPSTDIDMDALRLNVSPPLNRMRLAPPAMLALTALSKSLLVSHSASPAPGVPPSQVSGQPVNVPLLDTQTVSPESPQSKPAGLADTGKITNRITKRIFI